jgi:hypothetical protein
LNTWRMTKILFVDSVDDSITQRRHRILASDPRLAGYELYYFYAAVLTPEQEAVLAAGVAPDLKLVEEDLANRLDNEIKSIEPQFVLLHTGFVFRRFPSAFFRVFAQLKEKHPTCRFGIQPREGLSIDQAAFHQTDEVIKLQHLVFREVLNL